MGISYNERERVFRLDTPRSTYLIGLVDEAGFPGHMYYGRRFPDDNLRSLLRVAPTEPPFRASGRQLGFLDSLPVEYSGHGQGDFRESCLRVETEEGGRTCGVTYVGHEIRRGKPALPDLPATFGGEEECETLELVCADPVLKLEIRLSYTAFEDLDAICRSVRIVNRGDKPLALTAALSACLDMDNRDFDIITLHGRACQERIISRRRLNWGKQGVASRRGISSHQENPFLALAEHTATQTRGQVYAMNFVYSGNFLAQAEMTQEDQIRVVMGIHPEDFRWRLAPGEAFQTPEVVMVFSDAGLGGMTRTFHDLYRRHLIRGPYRDKPRPSLVNSWEAAYFNFNTEKLLDIARSAAASGIELFVLDDGWFGNRNDDRRSLGDWYVNEEKLPGGLKYLADEINKLGMKFGLWMEPEMVCPDSDLYRAHPDYALQVPGRAPTLERTQLVLDLSRPEVRECVYSQIHRVLSSANIEYVKWDMNRELTDVYGACLGPDGQGELYHRYMLGVYELQERMLRDFPHLLLENCASGGSRFDPGMLYYSPQIWTSDNTDAIDRLLIQEGTALVYPLSTMGAHVAACPSHINCRSTPFSTRALVSLPGSFGYELDLTKLTEEDTALIPGQLENYRRYGGVFREGDYYRLASCRENHTHDAWMSVSKDKTTAALVYVRVTAAVGRRTPVLYLQGLAEDRLYRLAETGEVRSGAGWMYGGVLMPPLRGDFQGKLLVWEAVEA